MTKTIQTCHIANGHDVAKRVVSFKSVLSLARCKKHVRGSAGDEERFISIQTLNHYSLSLSWMPDLVTDHLSVRITTDT